MNDTIEPTSLGLLRCLQALADEAISLDLGRTSKALNTAIATCRAEIALDSLVPRSPADIVRLH